MTTYLIKEENGKTHHFRVTIENYHLEIVQGVFYNWMSKTWEWFDNNENTIKRQKELVNEKLLQGYIITVFKTTLENNVNVYDKAKWHYSGDFPKDLDSFQGYVHTGIFLGWLIESNLVSVEFENENKKEIDRFKKRQLTGPNLFQVCCDGVLLLEDISELGNRFALAYFDFETGLYLKDYERILLQQNKPTLYHIEDNWYNYFKIKKVLDHRYSYWTNLNNQKPFWEL